MIRLIGIDVDGTLLNTRAEIPRENIDAIHEAVGAGVHVALVTGRSYPFVRPLADPLPPSITLIVSNGAIERDMNGGRRALRLLDRTVARAVLEATKPHRHAAALVFDRDADRQVMFETMDWEHPARKAYWRRNQSLIAQAVPLEDALVEDPIQVMFNGGVEPMRLLVDALKINDGTFSVSLTEYVHRDFSLVDVTAPAATKGRALAWRAGQLGIAREEVMAVGDNFNDLEMLEYAGLPVVMGNAVGGLKNRGWVVTGDNDHAGLAEAIRRFALH